MDVDEDRNDEQWALDDIDGFDDEPSTEPVETRSEMPRRGRGFGTRLGISVPGAVAGVFLVCALAFGASLTGSIRPLEATDTATTDGAGADGVDAPDPGAIDGVDVPGADAPGVDEPGAGEPGTGEPGAGEPGTDGDGPTATPPSEEHPDATPKATEKPKAEPTPEPKSEPTPTPKPELVHFRLTLSLHEGAVLIDWTACDAAGGAAYKVVRSSDSTITWPMGEHDVLLKVVGIDGPTKAWDEHPPAGRRSFYRVFCVAAGNDGHTVVGVSNVESIVAPAEPTPTPTPEPQSMSIEISIGDGGIVISWEACTGDGFSHYRILRKTTGEPTLLAEVANVGDTTFVDTTAESGVEYHYLVQCKGHAGDGYVLLGTTAWAGIVAP